MAAGMRLDFDAINRAGLATLPALLRRWLSDVLRRRREAKNSSKLWML